MASPRPRAPANHQQKYRRYFSFPQTGVGATGTVVCDTNANMADGDTVTLNDGFTKKTYEYDKAADGVTAGNVAWTAGTTAATVAANLRTAILANQPAFTVTDLGNGTLNLLNRWPGAGGNNTSTKSSSSTLAVTGMSGGSSPCGVILADTTFKLGKIPSGGRSIKIERVMLNLPLGLAQDASNYCTFKLLKGASTVIASWSTQTTTGQGTITADTPVELVMSSTLADTYLADTDTMSLFVDVTGSPSVPPGLIEVEGTEL